MEIAALRAKHTRFTYRSHEINRTDGAYVIRYHFHLAPDISFTPEIVIPAPKAESIDKNDPFFKLLIFNLGMVEAISYWKAACPPELVIEAGSLTDIQIAWWHDLFINGLGEFFYKNQIDFIQPDFLTIQPSSHLTIKPSDHSTIRPSPLRSNLIMVGGGKDSAVTLELLKHTKSTNNVLLLNPTPATFAVTKTAGYDHPIVVKRTIDPKLLELNANGYLNGHTPFSAYLAFLGTLVATIHGYQYVIASNEASASEGNIEYLGTIVNHQYSKGFAFETKFREYIKSYGPEYFSLLRPLSELQIASLFSKMTRYHPIFISCNANRGTGWCGSCAKCAFVYTILSPFLSQKKMMGIFGSDFFEKKELRQHFLDLAGIGEHKPFDCVGTKDETRDAIALTIANYRKQNIVLPPVLVELKEKLTIPDTVNSNKLFEKLQTSWNPTHFLPAEYEKTLKSRLVSM